MFILEGHKSSLMSPPGPPRKALLEALEENLEKKQQKTSLWQITRPK